MKNQFHPKYQQKYFLDFCPGSLLLQGYYKTESIFLQTEHRLFFCVNLEVVSFQGRNIFIRILSKLIFHKDILKLTDFSDLTVGKNNFGNKIPFPS